MTVVMTIIECTRTYVHTCPKNNSAFDDCEMNEYDNIGTVLRNDITDEL